MTRTRIPAVFVRGGTSKGVVFKEADLPVSRAERDALFLRVLGSPDPYQRQLDGMGGGLSSVSKVAVVAPSARTDVDIDYTFVQVAVDAPVADYGQACGNLSAAIGPYAVEEGMVPAGNGATTVRVYSTNTNQVFHAHFEVRDGVAVEAGAFELSGVAGTGARIRLDYLDPGGARSRAFVPTGRVVDTVAVPGLGDVDVSLLDATNPVVFVEAQALGVEGTELPDALESNAVLMERLEHIRRWAGVASGEASTAADVPLSNPKVALVSAPATYSTLSGRQVPADGHDISIRIASMGRMHRAVTGTGAMCLAAACRVSGSLPHTLVTETPPDVKVRIGSPSGVTDVAADVGQHADGEWWVSRTTAYRTQRRLMEGAVVLPQR